MTLAAAAEAHEGNPPRMELLTFQQFKITSMVLSTSPKIQTAMQASAAAHFFQTEVNKYGALLVEELVASVDLT